MERRGLQWTHPLGRTLLVWNSKRIRGLLSYNTPNGRGPEVRVHRRGRNGSAAGFGPKCWPRLLRRWTRGCALCVPLPYISWGRAYRLRRCGTLRVWRVLDRVYRTICWGPRGVTR